ncbi:MAG: hypothetical protein GWO24_14870, partial [Akkermansiaceae bacterium]|nr:hypothetical protein [Akkermansiaceae bacterium]NIV19932.1 hypothetical protein [Gammaproteobacteria bacterium]
AGVQIETNSGDELLGFVSSETDQQITLRMAGGLVRTLKPAELKSRRELAQSLMPAGLAALLHPLELA